MLKKYLLLIFFFSLISANANSSEPQACLIEAYPKSLTAVNSEGDVEVNDGTVIIFDQKLKSNSHEFLLEHGDLKAQFSQKYSVAKLSAPPNVDWDPGRLRSETLFRKLYGESEKEVKKNLIKVWWHPCECYVLFSERQGAAEALKRVGEIAP